MIGFITLALFPAAASLLLLGVAVRHEQVALLSLIGGVVCLLGAWLMKRAAAH